MPQTALSLRSFLRRQSIGDHSTRALASVIESVECIAIPLPPIRITGDSLKNAVITTYTALEVPDEEEI